MDIAAIMISACTAAFAAVVAYLYQRKQERRDKRMEEKNKFRSQENVLILKGINAVGKLSMAIASDRGKEQIELAMEEYRKTDSEIYEYLLKINSVK